MGEPIGKFMNFISENQLEENKKAVGERVEDGTVTVDKPLYEILKEQKEKKDAELKEKFRNLPPKGLDEEEMEFLDTLVKHQKEQEREVALEDQEALVQFQTAVLSRTVKVDDPRKLQGASTSSDSQGAGAKRKGEQRAQQAKAKSLFAPKFKVGVVVQAKKAKVTAEPQGRAPIRAEGAQPCARERDDTKGMEPTKRGSEVDGMAREPLDGSRGGSKEGSGRLHGGGSAGGGTCEDKSRVSEEKTSGLGGLLAYGDDDSNDDEDNGDKS